MIRYLVGDATRPVGDGAKIIAHICNDAGAWCAGFVMAVSARCPKPADEYRLWHRDGDDGNPFELGAIQLVMVESDTWVCNMIAQVGYGGHDGPPIRYVALAECLRRLGMVARVARDSIHMPRIGCGLAGGSWDRVEPIVKEELANIDVCVYDLPGTT